MGENCCRNQRNSNNNNNNNNNPLVNGEVGNSLLVCFSLIFFFSKTYVLGTCLNRLVEVVPMCIHNQY